VPHYNARSAFPSRDLRQVCPRLRCTPPSGALLQRVMPADHAADTVWEKEDPWFVPNLNQLVY
jgi:hypothetical protein